MTALGPGLILLGLLASILAAHFKARPFYDRPGFARSRIFLPALAAVKWMLIPGGLAVLFGRSRGTAILVAALLALVWGYLRSIRSVAFQRWLLRRDYRAVKRARPELAERDILYALLSSRHPQWGDDLIQQMVLDYPTIEALARIVARMERGFRGFR